MGLKFDQTLQYQFVLFYGESKHDPTELRKLPSIISEQLPGVKSLGLKFGTREREQGLAAPPGGPPLPMLQWNSGSGVWKLIWTPIRLDLVFDAAGFAEIAAGLTEVASAEPPKPRTAIDRVTPNLREAVKQSSRPINRMAFIVTGKSSCQGSGAPTEIVARHFFTESTLQDVKAGKILDLNARVNTLGLGEFMVKGRGSVPFRINHIENGSSDIGYEGGTESVSLTWQLDVNTSPTDIPVEGFEADAVPQFFNHAEAWIEERFSALEALSASK